MLIQVQALVPPESYDGKWRARRKWPSAAPVTVEVLDQDADPPDIVTDVAGETRLTPDPTRIGLATLDALQADREIMVRLVDGEEAEDLAALEAKVEVERAEHDRLLAERDRLLARHAELDAQAAELEAKKAQLEAQAAELAADRAKKAETSGRRGPRKAS